jgi:hypothetical protein
MSHTAPETEQNQAEEVEFDHFQAHLENLLAVLIALSGPDDDYLEYLNGRV